MSQNPANKAGKFGKIALELGLVTLDQIQECLSVQMDFERAGREVPKLGTVLLAKSYLNSSQLKQILDRQNTEKQQEENKKASSFIEQYKPGTVIFKEGELNARDLFLIQNGTVEMSKRNIPLSERCGPGSFLGITGCLLKTPRSATAIAKTECSIYRIPESQAQAFFRTKPEMAVKLATILAKNLFTITNQYVETKLYTQSKPPVKTVEDDNSLTVQLSDDNTLTITDLSAPVMINNLQAGIGSVLRTGDKLAFCGNNIQIAPVEESVDTVAFMSATPPTPTLAKTSVEILPEQTLTKPVDFELPVPPAKTPLAEEIKPNTTTTSWPTEKDEPSNANHELSGAAAAEAEMREAEDSDNESDEDETEESFSAKPFKRPEMTPPKPGNDIFTGDPKEILAYIDNLPEPKFTKEVIEATSKRIEFLMQIEKLDEKRICIENNETGVSDQVKNEINRQRREAQRIPPREALENSLQKIIERLNPPEPQLNEDEENAAPPPPPPLEEDMREVYELAAIQKKILLARDDSTEKTLNICMTTAVNEPLYIIFAKHDIPAETLFGWGIYAMALKNYADAQNPRIKALRQELNDLAENTNKGFLGLGKKKTDESHIRKLEEEENLRKLIITNVNRELKTIEKDMVNILWEIYEQAALLLIKGLPDNEQPFVRGFIRWGLLGHSKLWMPQHKCKKILQECCTQGTKPIFSMKANHIYYSDEIIEFIANGLLPPTSNEDLELNQRNTPLWRADRAWRKIINNKMQIGLLNDILQNVDEEAKSIRSQQNDAEGELERAHSRANDKERRKVISQIRHQIQNLKVKAARLERISEKIREEMLPKLADDSQNSRTSLTDSGITFSPEDLARHEIKCMRRNARLVAKLKEPFLPFTLLERYRPENDCTNDRESVQKSLHDAQARDPLIFSEPLIPTAKKIHRILMRIPPIIIIAPANGILGFMMSPRAGVDCGRIVLPAYFERANMREEILWNVLSDFRFDTSKASAGVDIMNSDTLIAAYSEVRWNLRKRDKETRQKAAIYMEENERTNWRRHYNIYMKSALDSGKLLFYKCPELYELIINKFVDLPQGCEILKR